MHTTTPMCSSTVLPPMSPLTITILVTAIVLFDLMIVAAVLTAVSASIRTISKQFPPVAPAADAVTKNFQSFKLGLLGLGKCIHASVDEHYLHLRPCMLARWIRVPPMSVPWAQVQVTGSTFASRLKLGKSLKAKLGTLDIEGPEWCLNLAAQSTRTTESRPDERQPPPR